MYRESGTPLTKIIATLGPASDELDTILELIREGVRCFRINFSHGDFEEYESRVHRVREASERTGVLVSVLGDLSGPKIRLGQVVTGGVKLAPDDEVFFVRHEVVAGAAEGPIEFSTNYDHFLDEVQPGEAVLLNDGNVRLRAEGRDGDRLCCRVVHGGNLTSRKGVNLPDTELSVPALTERDRRCAAFAIQHGFDLLALSFVRRGRDVEMLREELQRIGAPHDFPICAKIEKPQAIDDLAAILDASDFVMVARGDLGVEMDIAEVAVIQRGIVDRCHERGVPVIVATQMLESMIHAPVPTRAEVSDVANAIFQSVDAVMLSGETAVGRYPVETVKMMGRVVSKTNVYIRRKQIATATPSHPRGSRRTEALAEATKSIGKALDVKLIAAWCDVASMRDFSKHHIQRPILAFGADPVELRFTCLLYGIAPIHISMPETGRDFVAQVDEFIKEKGWAESGDAILLVLGSGHHGTGPADKVHVHYIDNPNA
ncbi:MAG: pyruvate kinase [Planctomycetota bacterium]